MNHGQRSAQSATGTSSTRRRRAATPARARHPDAPGATTSRRISTSGSPTAVSLESSARKNARAESGRSAGRPRRASTHSRAASSANTQREEVGASGQRGDRLRVKRVHRVHQGRAGDEQGTPWAPDVGPAGGAGRPRGRAGTGWSGGSRRGPAGPSMPSPTRSATPGRRSRRERTPDAALRLAGPRLRPEGGADAGRSPRPRRHCRGRAPRRRRSSPPQGRAVGEPGGANTRSGTQGGSAARRPWAGVAAGSRGPHVIHPILAREASRLVAQGVLGPGIVGRPVVALRRIVLVLLPVPCRGGRPSGSSPSPPAGRPTRRRRGS